MYSAVFRHQIPIFSFKTWLQKFSVKARLVSLQLHQHRHCNTVVKNSQCHSQRLNSCKIATYIAFLLLKINNAEYRIARPVNQIIWSIRRKDDDAFPDKLKNDDNTTVQLTSLLKTKHCTYCDQWVIQSTTIDRRPPQHQFFFLYYSDPYRRLYRNKHVNVPLLKVWMSQNLTI